MPTLTYEKRRGQLETYFDRTAVQAWARLTSDAPVSRIRATVRAGRDRMRATLLSWLPEDLHGLRVLDAGCGPGAMTMELARRGAEVLAVDLSPTLVDLARERLAQMPDAALLTPRIQFLAVDMLAADHGHFDHVVAMDSLIHYGAEDAARALGQWTARTRGSTLFTFAPRTPALATMHAVGRLLPRGDRAPSIVPVVEARLQDRLHRSPDFEGWQAGRSERIASGFYTSQASEWRRRD